MFIDLLLEYVSTLWAMKHVAVYILLLILSYLNQFLIIFISLYSWTNAACIHSKIAHITLNVCIYHMFEVENIFTVTNVATKMMLWHHEQYNVKTISM